MLPGGTDASYRQALAGPHEHYVQVQVLDGTGNVLEIPADRVGEDGGLMFLSGSVTATLANRVTRTLNMTVDEALYPYADDDLLSPYGNRLRVWRGVKFATGDVYRWVVFTGRIHSVEADPDGQVALSALDRGNEVVEAQFLRPENSVVGNTVNAEFVRLVSDGVPDASFGVSDTFGLTVPQLTWESDRAGALEEMATSAGAYWYTLGNGDFVIRRYPFAVPAVPVVTLSDGEGGIIRAAPSREREDSHNSITVTGERADGTAPVYAVAQDANPSSPTYIRGNFGLRHKTLRLRTPATQGAAQTAANDYLRTAVALTQAWSWAQVPDAALELGDAVTLNTSGQSGIIQVVSGFTLPLDTEGMMAVTGRDLVIGVLEA